MSVDAASPAGFTVVYALEDPPEGYSRSVFAAGPTPRVAGVPSWRPELLELLKLQGFDGVVFVPESRAGVFHGDYLAQVEWERRCLELADVILFWVPRDLVSLPGFTTNVEFGSWAPSGKAVLGFPPDSPGNKYLEWLARFHGVPVASSLADTVGLALSLLGAGSWRVGPQRRVRLGVWESAGFQNWFTAQSAAGHQLQDSRELFSFGHDGVPFLSVLHVDVSVAGEDRRKTNEIVVMRPDTASVLAYCRGSRLEDTRVVLVREYRAAASNAGGFIWELPGGSGAHDSVRRLAHAELWEETGLLIEKERLREEGVRQFAGTLLTHQGFLFSVELTSSEMDGVAARSGVVLGQDGDSERTWPVVATVGELLNPDSSGVFVDWSALGMVLKVLAG